MARIPHEHTTKIYQTPRAKYRDGAIIAPANITGGKDVTKFNQKIEIKQTLPDLVAQEVASIIDTNSILYHAVTQYRSINQSTGDKLYISPVQDDVLGAKATRTISFVGTTISETVTKKTIKSSTGKVYTFNFAQGTTVNEIATQVKDVFNANTAEIFTSSATANVITQTAVNAGQHMNGDVLDLSNFVLPGIDVVATPFANGAVDGDISTALTQYEQDNVDILTLESAAQTAIDHVANKYGITFTDAKKKGLVYTPTSLSLSDIANAERIGKGFCEQFFNKADTSKLPADVDGTYGATIQLHPYLAMVGALAYALKKNQDGEETGRPITDKYGPVGGPNQYNRTFHGTPLPTLPLSPFAKMTAPTMMERKQILDKKGYAYYFLDSLEQGALLSQLYLDTDEMQNNPRRTVCQYDDSEFKQEQYNNVLQEYAELQWSQITEAKTKKDFMARVDRIVEQYPNAYATEDMVTKQKDFHNKLQFFKGNNTIRVNYAVINDGHPENIVSETTVYTQAQLQ